MKKNCIKLVGSIIALCIVGSTNLRATNTLIEIAEAKKKTDTIQLTHHVIWINALLKKQPVDIRDLEFQYNQLLVLN